MHTAGSNHELLIEIFTILSGYMQLRQRLLKKDMWCTHKSTRNHIVLYIQITTAKLHKQQQRRMKSIHVHTSMH